MATLDFELSGARDVVLRAYFDGQALDFGILRKVSVEAEPGIHVLQIFASGAPGTSFRLSMRDTEGGSPWSKDFRLPSDGIVAVSKKVNTTKWPGPRKVLG
jgi:hypothetical protein